MIVMGLNLLAFPINVRPHWRINRSTQHSPFILYRRSGHIWAISGLSPMGMSEMEDAPEQESHSRGVPGLSHHFQINSNDLWPLTVTKWWLLRCWIHHKTSLTITYHYESLWIITMNHYAIHHTKRLWWKAFHSVANLSGAMEGLLRCVLGWSGICWESHRSTLWWCQTWVQAGDFSWVF